MSILVSIFFLLALTARFIFCIFFFFFNDTATTEIYTLSLHDALPISTSFAPSLMSWWQPCASGLSRSEEHTSELQSQFHLVCRLLLEKKKNNIYHHTLLKKNKKLENITTTNKKE